MISNHKPKYNLTLSVQGRRADWEAQSDVSVGGLLFYRSERSWASEKVGCERLVSPPNLHCFFNSLFAHLRLFAVVTEFGTTTVLEQFTTICGIIVTKYADGFIDGAQMQRIVEALGVTVIGQVQLRTMLRNKATKHLDFCKPMLIKLDASEYLPKYQQNTGHVGFVVPHNKTKKITYQQLIDALEGRVRISCVPSSNLKKQKQRNTAPLTEYKNFNGMLAYLIRNAQGAELKPHTADLREQKDWAYSLVMGRLGDKVKIPNKITSAQSLLIVSYFHKRLCDSIWQDTGKVVEVTQYAMKKYGFAPLASAVLSVTGIILGGFWESTRARLIILFLTAVLILSELVEDRMVSIIILGVLIGLSTLKGFVNVALAVFLVSVTVGLCGLMTNTQPSWLIFSSLSALLILGNRFWPCGRGLRLVVFVVSFVVLINFMSTSGSNEHEQVVASVNKGIQGVETLFSKVSDYHADHWLDLVRQKPVVHKLPRLSVVEGQTWAVWFMSFIPQKDGSFINWLFQRQAVEQFPVLEFVWNFVSNKSLWSGLKAFFFDGEFDHTIHPICYDGVVFSDESWLCYTTTGISQVLNRIIQWEYTPQFVCSWKVLLYSFVYMVVMTYKRECIEIQGYVAKKINSACIERIPRESLPHLYRSQVIKLKTDSNRFGGIRVSKTKSGKVVSHSPVGIIDPQFNKVLTAYGWGFTGKEINESSHYSGGHANLRAAVDALQADSLQRIISSILDSGDGAKFFEIVDVGAKFAKISRILIQSFSPQPRDFCSLRQAALNTPLLGAEGVQVLHRTYQQAVGVWNLTVGRYTDNASFMNAVNAFIDTGFVVIVGGVPQAHILGSFCDKWSAQVLVRYSNVISKVTYLPVRPRQNEYDRNYFTKQYENYVRVQGEIKGLVLSDVFQGKIQDFRGCSPNVRSTQRFYLVFDSHYYLEGWKANDAGRVLLVGGDFCSRAGSYRLPLGQGQYKVYRGQEGRAMMQMVCSSSGTFYEHPLVHVAKTELRMDYGWYAHLAHDCSTQTLDISGVYLPRGQRNLELMCEQKSGQGNWMVEFVTQCQKAAKTITKYSAYDRLFWETRAVTEEGSWWFKKGQWQRATLFVQLNHDFTVCPQVKLVRVWGGILGSILRLLSLAQRQQTMVSQHRTVKEQGRMWTRRQVSFAGIDRSEHIRYGYIPNAADIHLNGGPLTRQLLQDLIQIQLPRVKVPKLPITTKSDLVEQVPMFFTKPTPKVEYVSPHLIRDDAESRRISNQTVDRVNEYLVSLGEDQAVKKGSLVDRQIVSKVIRTGYSFLNAVREFEWSSKSLKNAIYAMYHRHLSCRLQPELVHIAAFSQMTDRYFKRLCQKLEASLKEDPKWDPIQAIKQKKDFSRKKKALYYSQLLQALSTGKILPGSFMTMVKSGEVYYSEDLRINGTQLHGQSSRPRNIMIPSNSLCGVLTLLQNVLWGPLKKAEQGFIQGLTKDELLEVLTRGVGDHWRVICIDGSSFDSTQNQHVMKNVDDKFWKGIEGGLLAVLHQLKRQSPNVFKSQPEEVLAGIMKQILQPYNVCFTNLPGVRRVVWPDHIWALWGSTWAKQVEKGTDRDFVQSNYIFNQINGTTFSGHPTKTTMGNTLRSLCYAFYYLELEGIRDPWNDKRVRVYAAGDDVMIFCTPELEARIKARILMTTSRGDVGTVGLGQRVKQVFTGGLSDIDFCSKWAFGNSVATLNLVRDVHKTLSTRQYYGKQNQTFVSHPGLHAKAILEGFRCDKISHLIQDILQIRVAFYGLPEKYSVEGLRSLSDHYRNTFSGKGGYQSEHQVNSKCGITTTAMYRLMLDFTLAPITYTNSRGDQVRYGYVPRKIVGSKIASEKVGSASIQLIDAQLLNDCQNNVGVNNDSSSFTNDEQPLSSCINEALDSSTSP